MPTANAETMSLHLDAISRKVAAGAHAILVFDGAGYHGAGALAVPENITLLRLTSGRTGGSPVTEFVRDVCWPKALPASQYIFSLELTERHQGRAVSNLRSMESAIALYPASCGWR
jgi:hypothetical protein